MIFLISLISPPLKLLHILVQISVDFLYLKVYGIIVAVVKKNKRRYRMRIAIYARQSRFTGRGESVENQVKFCKEHILNNRRFAESNPEFFIFEDEGYSGKNTSRPKYREMMEEEDKNPFDFIIVYRLDRLSRSVSDFFDFLGKTDKLGTFFITVSENYDTSDTMGKAVLQIASIFAEMERNIISERIRDNMHMLARTGRWLGGTAPAGYVSIRNKDVDIGDGKKRSSYSLAVDEEHIGQIKLIINKFLELQSLRQLETYLLNNEIKTKKGKNYTISTLRNILKNPVYCIADEISIKYYTENGCDVYYEKSDIDNVSGFITYNKTKGDLKRTKNSMNDWIISIGTHKGIVNGKDWIKIQEILETNSHKGFRKVHSSTALLSGILRCRCGAYMRPKNDRKDKNGNLRFYYICETKEKSKRKKCCNKNINGIILDEQVVNEITNFDTEGSNIYNQLEILKNNIRNYDKTKKDEIKILRENKKREEQKIQNFIDTLAQNRDKKTRELILDRISIINDNIANLDVQIKKAINNNDLFEKASENYYTINQVLENFSELFKKCSVIKKRECLRSVIDRIIWDGETVSIFMHGIR